MKTKNWSYFILGVYFIINIVLVMGISYFAVDKAQFSVEDYFLFGLVVAAIMFICQALLFGLKVDVLEKRPESRRKIGGTAIVVALLMAFITYFLFFTLLFVLFGEGEQNPLNKHNQIFGFLFFFVFFASWIFWSFVFIAMGRKQTANRFMKKTMAMLIKGSVLELLVAIPSHIIMRNRHDCCAPVLSYMGIITGFTVLLFAFGPAIIVLYHYRMKAKRGNLSFKEGVID